MNSEQGVQDLGSGFSSRIRSISPNRNKKARSVRRGNKTMDSFEQSADDLDLIPTNNNPDDSATAQNVPKSRRKTATVYGKEVELSNDHEPLPRSLKFKKTRSTKSPQPQTDSNTSNSSRPPRVPSTRSVDGDNTKPPVVKPSRPQPRPIKKNPVTPVPEGPAGPNPPSRESSCPPKATTEKTKSRTVVDIFGEVEQPPVTAAKRVPSTPKRKTRKANVSTGSSPFKPPGYGKRNIAPFPMSQAPQRKPAVKTKRKIVMSSDDSSSEDEDKLAVFPMSPNTLQSLRSSSPASPSSPEVRRQSPKRNQGPSRKKKRSGDTLARAISISDGEVPDDVSGSDLLKLCPYCDAVLPKHPSPQLLSLLINAAAKSYPEPRPNNPDARSAPFATYIIVCQRHDFENDLLPKAKAYGWPLNIDWQSVVDRVQSMRRFVNNLISRPHGPERKQSVFWRDITRDIKVKGTTAVRGVHGQYQSFERIQPGYYGEMGSVIIHQTLFTMFPLVSFNPRTVEPLTPEEFTRSVIVPEVVVRLIMEDQSIPEGPVAKKQAIEVMRESAAYGTAMFPEDGGEGNKTKPASKKKLKQKDQDAFVEGDDSEMMGVADMILLERARQRRKEIQEEEGTDVMMDEDEPKPPPRPPRRLKPTSSAMSIDSVHHPPCSSSDIEPMDHWPASSSRSKPSQKTSQKSTRDKRSSAKKLGLKAHEVDIELSSDGEIMTSNEDGAPPASSVILGSSTLSSSNSELAVEQVVTQVPNPDSEIQQLPRSNIRPGGKSRSGRRESWSYNLADPNNSGSSSERLSPPPVKILKEGHRWLLDDM